MLLTWPKVSTRFCLISDDFTMDIYFNKSKLFNFQQSFFPPATLGVDTREMLDEMLVEYGN